MEISVSAHMPIYGDLSLCPFYAHISVCVPFMPIYGDIWMNAPPFNANPIIPVYMRPFFVSILCPYAHIWRSLYLSVSLLCLLYSSPNAQISVSAHI